MRPLRLRLHGPFLSGSNTPADPGSLNLEIEQRFAEAVESASGGGGSFTIRNTDRTVGARLSGRIAAIHGNRGMEGKPIHLLFNGTAGQSFGAWNAGGLNMVLTGDANDYVGKGMAGGKLVIRPPLGVAYESHEAVIIGNTCLTGQPEAGCIVAGRAGERFAVRNSGAQAVVEGIGDNGCEYMTGGIVTILGETGVNFGAGMTGGFAYVLDESRGPCLAAQFGAGRDLAACRQMRFCRNICGGSSMPICQETGSKWAEKILDRI